MRLSLVAFAAAAAGVAGLIHEPEFAQDGRKLFEIETFGFLAGGQMKLQVKDFHVLAKPEGDPYPCVEANNTGSLEKGRNCDYKVALLMMHTASKSSTQQKIEEAEEDERSCMLDDRGKKDILIDLSDSATWDNKDVMSFNYTFPEGAEGFYSLIFNRCDPPLAEVSFSLYAVFKNPGDYLSAGDSPLPAIYIAFAGAFFLALLAWLHVLRTSDQGTVMHIHKLMAVLLVFKVLTLVSNGARFQVVKHTGHAEAWAVVFYVFTFLRSISLFVVILLIGSGWSLLKPSLNEREKKAIFVVLTLQVLDNIAFLIVEDTAPGSQSYVEWRDVLHLVDIICCCAILFPIVWSIRHLRQGAGTDGKAAANLKRLETFRYFYIMVITYIYFTRIVVYLLAATLPFQYIWMKEFFEEFATLVFYVLTGVQFRPAEDNPYVKLSQHDDDGQVEQEEFGLLDEGPEKAERNKTVLTEV